MKTLVFSRNPSILLFALIMFSVLGVQQEAAAQQSPTLNLSDSDLQKLLQSKVPGLRIQVDTAKLLGGNSRIDSNIRRVILNGYRKRREELAYLHNDSAMVKKMTINSKMPVLILESADPMPGSNPPTIGPTNEIPIPNVEQLIEGKVPKRPRKTK